jgi:pimeloyl-ACP methyl ester carboxylesterase
MSEDNVEEIKMALDSPEELATAHSEAARAIREDPEGIFAELSEELPEADRQMLERPDVRAFLIEALQEAVRQGAPGWIDDDVRQVRPWPFRVDEISGVDVRIYHGEVDTLVPVHHAKHLAEGIPGSRLYLYPGEGHLSMDKHVKDIVETLLTTWPVRRSVRKQCPSEYYSPNCLKVGNSRKSACYLMQVSEFDLSPKS